MKDIEYRIMTNLSESVTPLFDDVSADVVTATIEMEVDGGGTTKYKFINNLQGLILGTSLLILIVITNLLSLGAFTIEKRLRTYNNYFIINLAISDLVVGITQVVGVVHTFLGYFPGSQNFCRVYVGVRNAMFSVSVVGVIIICIDRYRATYDPINHFMTRSKRKAVILNIMTWIIPFGFWMPFSTGWDFIVDADSGKSCLASFSRIPIANMFQTIVTFFIPLAIISVLYLRIYIKIKETISGKSVNKEFGDLGGGGKSMSTSLSTVCSDVPSDGMVNVTEAASNAQVKITVEQDRKVDKGQVNGSRTGAVNRESPKEMKKATRTLSYIVFSFVIAWLPNSVIYFLYAVNPQLVTYENLPRDLRQFFVWLRYGNSFLNPICYLVSQPLFRQTIVNMLCRPRRYC